MDKEAREAQEDAARHHGTRKAELAADVLLFLRQAIRRKGDEHDVVHTENDLQEDERDQADPRFRARKD